MASRACLRKATHQVSPRKLGSPRAVALAYVGRMFHLFHLHDLRRSLEAWIASAPEPLAEDFTDAAEELQRSPEPAMDILNTLPVDPALVTDVLADLLLREDTPEAAKRRGAVFTPAWLAQRVARSAAMHWHRLHRSGRSPQLIADVACGPGAFLLACENVFRGGCQRILGIDSDPSAIAYARLLASAINAEWEVRCEDSLLQSSSVRSLFDAEPRNGSIERAVDILVGNPPFVRSQLLPPDYADTIRDAYPSTQRGNFDLSVAFIEHATAALAEGGIASYILTNKFMTSAYGEKICRKLSREVRVLSLEDFQDSQVFHGYTTYTCVLTFAKTPPAKRFLVTRFSQGVTGENDPGTGETHSLSSERLASHPWDFACDETTDILRRLRDPRHLLLSEVFGGILQGLRTGANQVFVIGAENEQGIEKELLLPFINGEHIRRCQVQSNRLSLIYPYHTNEFGEVRLIPEQALKSHYPTCWRYLCGHQECLVQRSQDVHSAWYAFSRSQNLMLARLRKLLVREMMPRAEFAADYRGEITFASGYALDATRMNDMDLTLFTAVLCTPTMEFALRHAGTQLQSGWFRLLKHHLRRVRVPYLSGATRSRAYKLAEALKDNPADGSSLQELDSLVAEVFELSEKHRAAIHTFLQDCHNRSLGSRPRAKEPQGTGSPSPVKGKAADPYEPVILDQYVSLHRDRADLQKAVTFVPNKHSPVHRWFKYTQGFGAELVSFLLDDLGVSAQSHVLDPFAGCGTTNVVCQQRRIRSTGVELSPLMAWIAEAKTRDWRADALGVLLTRLSLPAPHACAVKTYETSPFADYLRKAYSEHILTQLWTIAHAIDNTRCTYDQRVFLKLGLLSIMEEVSQIRKHGSHYRYMLKTESIGLQKLNIPILSSDADIRPILVARLGEMLEDVRSLGPRKGQTRSEIICADARHLPLANASVTHVITSPPYLNRNNYIAQQKAELALLSMVVSKEDYRSLVRSMLRSHVEADFGSGPPHSEFPEIQRIVAALELTENNNPRIPHMIAGYFEDISGVLRELHRVLTPSGQMAFVVGNSRWGGIVVPVDHLLAMIGEQLGFTAERIYVTRLKGNSPQQMRRYGRIPVRESIVVLRKK